MRRDARLLVLNVQLAHRVRVVERNRGVGSVRLNALVLVTALVLLVALAQQTPARQRG